ncbi:MAG: DUF6807 family protein, partial [Draconibacterium sp.]
MRTILIITIALFARSLRAQELARFKVLSEEDRLDAPVSVSLDGINYNTDQGKLVLYEKNKQGETTIPSQIESGHSARLWFLIKGEQKKGTTREFILKREEQEIKASEKVTVGKDGEDLSLTINNKPILKYRYAVTLPPKEANPLFKRSGYIHPLWSPEGQELTRIQAPDHYHHYGIWGPWTKTHIDGREVDFWNLLKGQGTV